MKKSITILTLTMFMAGAMLISCQSSADKVLEAKNNLADANKELTQARKDSIQQFKEESLAKISNYENNIIEFKAGIANEKKENKAQYEKNIIELEQKISDIKIKLDSYKEEDVSKWKSFKNEFNHDMEEFGKALKNLTVKNIE